MIHIEDASQPDAGMAVNELSKESTGEAISLGSNIDAVEDSFPVPGSAAEQLAPEVAASTSRSYTGSGKFLHDGEGIH